MTHVDSREKLGNACGIQVSAAVVAITDNSFCAKKHKDFVFTPKMNHLDVWSYKKEYLKGGKTDAYN